MGNNDYRTKMVKWLRWLYPLWVVVGIFGIMYIPSVLIDRTDFAKTAITIEENELLFRLGIVLRLLSQILFICVSFLLYQLFSSFNKTVSTLMLILALVSVPIAMTSEAQMLGMLSITDNPSAIAELFETYIGHMTIATLFWGLWLLPLGWLAHHSNYFPKAIAILLYIGGSGYLLNSLISLLFPELKSLNLLLEFMTYGEVLFILWFVIMGIRTKGIEAFKN